MHQLTYGDRLQALIRADGRRMKLLGHVRALDLPDCWIGAGFVRNAVWDQLHRPQAAAQTGAETPESDVDVVWFDPARPSIALDRDLTDRLLAAAPDVPWSVKNQARMHGRNGDAPYAGCADALRHWPETATAVAVRLTPENALEILAPFGLDDLFGRLIRPTPAFRGAKLDILRQRVRDKRWLDRWPLLRVLEQG
ncbi:nucleotidyltransferase family protein [Nitrospirillum sp. BR 11163]|uniref:nucleotidyltransferase family protein n=1 Tax=Nitrospirillum sp. BR 11163 TaxID=3104323 RepID=UPI002AFE6BBB|nr:nucleotidyltransferase family protein [Nitrospirillum sp. BR 11163]MEA1674354.1 nucleotidyltransferase family protein [Nitrospirillum sp. BR 11163]